MTIDKERADKYISIIKKVFGDNFDRLWDKLIYLYILDLFEGKTEEEVENMLLDLKERYQGK